MSLYVPDHRPSPPEDPGAGPSRLRRLLASRFVTVAAAGAVTAALAGTVALAAPGAGEEISGCYHHQSGVLRVVESGESCRPQEQAVSWNRTGPAGAAGPEGPAGPPGPAGSGLGAIRRVGANAMIQPGQRVVQPVYCDAGEQVISGGWSGLNLVVDGSTETYDFLTGREGWAVSVHHAQGSEGLPVTVVAFCLKT